MSFLAKLGKHMTQFLILSAGSVCTIFGYKAYFQSENYKIVDNLADKTVIVTGANTGIGYHTAKRLAERGATVILACKDMNKCEKVLPKLTQTVMNSRVYCRHLDLSSQQSVLKFVSQQRTGSIDILILNAGVKQMSNLKHISEENIELNLAVNFIGNYLLIESLLNKKCLKSDGRIVGLLCSDAWLKEMEWSDLNCGEKWWPLLAYSRSKLALALYCLELNHRFQDDKSNIAVNMVDPQACFSDFERYMPHKHSTVSKVVFDVINFVRMRQPWQACESVLYAAVDSEMNLVSGKLICRLNSIPIPDVATNRTDQKKILLLGEKWTAIIREKVKQTSSTKS